MGESNQKGQELEEAVRLIEQTILETDPQLRGAPFEVKLREILMVSGSRYEIDVAVRANRGTPYESSHIFECKNWSAPVGQSEVVLLSHKVDAMCAAHGYLVAREFTQFARGEAAKHPRIRLVTCTSDFTSALDGVQPIATTSDFLELTALLKDRATPSKSKPDTMSLSGVLCFRDGLPVDATEFVVAHAKAGLDDELKKHATWQSLEGVHSIRIRRFLGFDPGELRIGPMDVEHMVLQALFAVHIRLPVITSKIEVHGRGRVYRFEARAERGLPAVSVQLVQRAHLAHSAG